MSNIKIMHLEIENEYEYFIIFEILNVGGEDFEIVKIRQVRIIKYVLREINDFHNNETIEIKENNKIRLEYIILKILGDKCIYR